MENETGLIDHHGIFNMPNPTDADLADPQFEAIWQAIKSWDVNAPDYYSGYMGATGSHVMVILQKLREIKPNGQ